MLEINLSTAAQEFIQALPQKYALQVVAKIRALAENPTLPRSKQLQGFGILRRIRSGDYRIIYFVTSDVLQIVLVDKRNDDAIYRHLRQLFR